MSLKERIQQAIDYGRSHQSQQTGLVHYHPHALEEESHDSIPVVENMLFALALMRSRTKEQFQEGVEVLGRLLSFQNEDGGFPTFLHQWPDCPNTLIGARLLPAFKILMDSSGQLMGKALSERCSVARERLQSYTMAQLEKINAPAHVTWPIRCSIGNPELEDLEPSAYGTSAHLAEIILALSYLPHPSKPEIWDYFWETFDPKRKIFMGACRHELYFDQAPLPGLYDLLTDSATTQPGGYQLLAALIPEEIEMKAPSTEFSGEWGGNRWERRYTDRYSITLMERQALTPEPQHPGFHICRLAWGDQTLVVHTESQCPATFKLDEDKVTIWVDLPVEDGWELNKRHAPLWIYTELLESNAMKVAGKPATVFQLGETIGICPDGFADIRIEQEDSKARYVGHLQRGNRPSQRHRRGDARFTAFDQSILLRAIQQSGVSRLRIEINLD